MVNRGARGNPRNVGPGGLYDARPAEFEAGTGMALEVRCPGICFHVLAPVLTRTSSALAIWKRRLEPTPGRSWTSASHTNSLQATFQTLSICRCRLTIPRRCRKE